MAHHPRVPTYDYACRSCGDRTEIIHSMLEDGPTNCELCGGDLRRVLYPTGIIFRGSGFYSTDSRKSRAGGERSATTGSASDGGASETGAGAGSSADGGSAATGGSTVAGGDTGASASSTKTERSRSTDRRGSSDSSAA